jgi:hypothetical protein
VLGRLASNMPGAAWFKTSGADWIEVATDGAIGGTSPDVAADTQYHFMAEARQGAVALPVDYTVTVRPHTVTYQAPTTLSPGQALSGAASTSMAGPGITWSLVDSPSWVTIGQDGSISGIAPSQPGASTIKVRVSKGAINAVSAPVTVSVIPQSVGVQVLYDRLAKLGFQYLSYRDRGAGNQGPTSSYYMLQTDTRGLMGQLGGGITYTNSGMYKDFGANVDWAMGHPGINIPFFYYDPTVDRYYEFDAIRF